MTREEARIYLSIIDKLNKDETQLLGLVGIVKNREVVAHFASGGEVEFDHCCDGEWDDDESPIFGIHGNYRIKKKTHTVNGFEVPEPEREPLQYGNMYYFISPGSEDWVAWDGWEGSPADLRRLERGLVFKSKKATIANAKAMCKVNPYGCED